MNLDSVTRTQVCKGGRRGVVHAIKCVTPFIYLINTIIVLFFFHYNFCGCVWGLKGKRGLREDMEGNA